MTCNIQMSAFANIQPGPRKKINFFFGPGDLLYSNDAHWEIASRLREEKRRSSKVIFCKSVSEERFAHKREICDFENPVKRGLCSRPKIKNTASLAAFARTSAFRPPVAYFNRQTPKPRNAGRLCARFFHPESCGEKTFLFPALRLDIVRTGA